MVGDERQGLSVLGVVPVLHLPSAGMGSLGEQGHGAVCCCWGGRELAGPALASQLLGLVLPAVLGLEW